MNISTALRLANYAWADSGLITNHTPVVPDRLNRELSDIDLCVSVYSEIPGEEDYIKELLRERAIVERALKVYNLHKESIA
jgi:hypothetical protein